MMVVKTLYAATATYYLVTHVKIFKKISKNVGRKFDNAADISALCLPNTHVLPALRHHFARHQC